MTSQVWMWIVGGLFAAIQTWFWFDRQNTQSRLDNIEKEMDTRFLEINGKLDVIKSQLDRDAGRERPAAACRDYMHNALEEVLKIVADRIELAILRGIRQGDING